MLTQEFVEDIKDTKQKSRGPFFLKYFRSKLRHLFLPNFMDSLRFQVYVMSDCKAVGELS